MAVFWYILADVAGTLGSAALFVNSHLYTISEYAHTLRGFYYTGLDLFKTLPAIALYLVLLGYWGRPNQGRRKAALARIKAVVTRYNLSLVFMAASIFSVVYGVVAYALSHPEITYTQVLLDRWGWVVAAIISGIVSAKLAEERNKTDGTSNSAAG